jgi:hypothetical protein
VSNGIVALRKCPKYPAAMSRFELNVSKLAELFEIDDDR